MCVFCFPGLTEAMHVAGRFSDFECDGGENPFLTPLDPGNELIEFGTNPLHTMNDFVHRILVRDRFCKRKTKVDWQKARFTTAEFVRRPNDDLSVAGVAQHSADVPECPVDVASSVWVRGAAEPEQCTQTFDGLAKLVNRLGRIGYKLSCPRNCKFDLGPPDPRQFACNSSGRRDAACTGRSACRHRIPPSFLF
jgi:hypothetical protein